MSRLILGVIILFTLFDSIVGALLYEFTGLASLAAAVIYVKYALFSIACLGFLYLFGTGFPVRRFELFGLLYIAIIAVLIVSILVVYPDHPTISRVYSYIFPPIIYFAGIYVSVVARIQWREALRYYLITYLAAAVLVGFPVFVLGPEWFWQDLLDYGGYITQIKGLDDVVMGLPANFVVDPWGERIPRFVGTLGDPLAVGYSSMILAFATWVAYPRWRYLFMAVFVAIIFAAYTRAALLGILVGSAAYFLAGRNAFRVMLGCCIVGVLFVLLLGDRIALLLGDSSTEGHVMSIGQVWDFLNPTTILLGSIGGGTQGLFEPGYFNILFTFGIVPFTLLVLFMGGIFRDHAGRDSDTQFIAVTFVAAAFTLSIFSPSFFAITSAWFAWFVAGVASGARRPVAALPAPLG